MNKNKYSTRDLVLLAMYAALFMAVELIQNQFGLFKMPQGGSLGVSSIILLLASYQLGVQKGVAISLLSILLQFLTGKMYLETGPIGFFLDYVLAFGIYGIASLFPNIKWFYSGVLITNTIRLVASTISGSLFYGLTLWPSFVYNATYMIPTMIVGLIFVPLIHQRLKVHNI